MNFLKKYGFYFLLVGAISDVLTPYVLGIFYPKMNQMTMVISVFGDVASPVRQAFLIWSVVSGLFFVLAIPAVYQAFNDTSKILSSLLTLAIGLYGVGDCIFTGLFSIDSEQVTWNFSTWIHNIGSGLGYAGFLLFPLFLYLLYQKQEQATYSRRYLRLLLISFFFAGIYGLARIPGINQLPGLNQIGICQRVSFIFNYLPIVIFALNQIKKGTLRNKH
ncbi:DUF998 domain-containing protein [Enterococcus caccae]|uniref:DUF998 domain-containing protein n=1 Tax=Enterococcus caccae ATCC BAA-1240 TaxID=1158612 RepID=R3W9J5_9ENTE|nr:DUF998 domain-containing protein [Enterococcus caccae]EOL44551.1 hypothetical protein UC7_02094 [Enterococcus caccae ATCC BAA-1240]EOT58694.1 hypothetical protein I580_02866 [Enterococcus caccae ATCC BAA-1240]